MAGFSSLNSREYWIIEMLHCAVNSLTVTADQNSTNVMVVNKIKPVKQSYCMIIWLAGGATPFCSYHYKLPHKE